VIFPAGCSPNTGSDGLAAGESAARNAIFPRLLGPSFAGFPGARSSRKNFPKGGREGTDGAFGAAIRQDVGRAATPSRAFQLTPSRRARSLPGDTRLRSSKRRAAAIQARDGVGKRPLSPVRVRSVPTSGPSHSNARFLGPFRMRLCSQISLYQARGVRGSASTTRTAAARRSRCSLLQPATAARDPLRGPATAHTTTFV